MENDLIRRSALLEEFDWVNRATAGEGNYEEDLRLLVKRVTEMPAEDAEPVRHGCWVPNKVGAIETQFKCSECDRTVTLCNDYFGKATKYASHSFPYCHCGAKMDLEVEW